MKIIPRQKLPPLFGNKPTGYMESDKDWVLANIEACVQLLEEKIKDNALEEYLRGFDYE